MPARRPFRSKAQARYLFSQKPSVARKFVREAKRVGVKHPIRNLPNRARKRRR